MVTRGGASSHARTAYVFWADRLSPMKWMRFRGGAATSTCFSNVRNSAPVWWAGVMTSTRPVATSSAEYSDNAPCRVDIFEPTPFRAAGRQRQDGIGAIQHLNPGLLVDAEHHHVLRGLQIEADDIGGFRLKVEIRTRFVAFEPMRLQAMPLPHIGDGGVREAQSLRQAPTRPARHGRRRFRLHGQADDLRFHRGGQPVPASRARRIRQGQYAALDVALTVAKSTIHSRYDRKRVPRSCARAIHMSEVVVDLEN